MSLHGAYMSAGAKASKEGASQIHVKTKKKLIAPGVLEEEMEGKGRGERGKGNTWCDMTFL